MPPGPDEPRRPNVLFVITDQHRADHVGFGGNDVVRTPHLDGLAARGTVFDAAWVANPVCMPNRASILTGRMPSAHGVIFNDRSLEWGAATHVRQLRRSGWRTALIGKSHLQHPPRSTGPLDPAVDHGYPPGWDAWEEPGRFAAGAGDMPEDFYGFGHVELALEHGGRVGGHHLRWCLERGGRIEDLTGPQTAEAPARRRSDRWWQIYQPPYPPELHSTSFVVDRTIAFVTECAASGDPWLAWASFPDPHHPMAVPGDWFDRHDPASIPLPPAFDDGDLFAHVPEHLRRTRAQRPGDRGPYVMPCGTDDPELVREYLAATYGLIELVDDGVGRILAAVEALGQTDDTIVVFTSDHGDMAGDHGLLLKGFMPFRGVLQVPLVIVDPRRAPRRTAALASSLDIGATLVDLCGVRGHDGDQGRSLVPVLDGAASVDRPSVLVEDDTRAAMAAMLGIPSRIRTVVTDDLKYTRDGDGHELLFDRHEDPYELHDLAHRPDGRLDRARGALLDALLAHTDEARGASLRAVRPALTP